MPKKNLKNGYSDHILSPLRYPGSKRRLAGFIRKTLEINDFRPKLYIEPFIGGASVALQLLVDDVVDQVILIDIDPLIAHFWEAVFFDTSWLVNQILSIDVSLEKWNEFKTFKPKSKRDFALTCLFLNRTSFSGIMRNEVGPLGGRDQQSIYKINCRFPRETLVKRIKRISQYRDKVFAIWVCSWSEGMKKIRKLQKSQNLTSESVFLYFDPPFFEKGESLYRHYFVDKDHSELRDFLLHLNDYWILSYDSAHKFDLLYGDAIKNNTNGTKKKDIELIYSTGVMVGRKPTKEVIISNFESLPKETKFWKKASGI